MERKLAAIMAADVAGYSRLMGEDEAGTRARFTAHLHKIIEPAIASHRGRIFKTMGDGLLVYFGYLRAHERDAERALRTGLGIVDAVAGLNAGADLAQGVELAVRIGIDTGLTQRAGPIARSVHQLCYDFSSPRREFLGLQLDWKNLQC